MGCVEYDGRFGGYVPTFDPVVPDGNRSFVLTEFSEGGRLHDIIINGSGKPADQSWQECFKLEGSQQSMIASVVRNCHAYAHSSAAASWSRYARNLRFAHMTFQNLGGPIGRLQQYTDSPGCPGCQGLAPLQDIRYKNIVILGAAQNPNCCTGWSDEYWRIELRGEDFEDVFWLDGATIETPDGTCNNIYINAIGGDGKQSLQWWEDNSPNVMNVDCTTDANIDNRPLASTNVSIDDYIGYYTPVNDTLSIANGSDLTVTTNAGTSQTSLCVEDILYFPDPDSGTRPTPTYGQFAGGYQINHNGNNLTYTNIVPGTMPAGCFTLAAPYTWGSGEPINVKITNGGSTPNRGAIL